MPSTLDSFIPRRFEQLPRVSTSTYELLENSDLSQKPFRAGVPSAYAASLSAHLSPLHNTALIATSMGGLVALESALHFADRVEKIVLINSTSCFTRKKKSSGEVVIPGVARTTVRAMRFGLNTAPRLTIEQFFARACASKTDAAEKSRLAQVLDPQRLAHGLDYLSTADVSGSLARITQPILIIQAANDKIIPPEAGRYMQELLPNSQFYLLPESGHQLSAHAPESVLELIEEFLQ